MTRILIVNADDFGMSDGINRGIVEAHECGVVTSASLMVRWDGALAAATYVAKRPQLSVGLHIDVAEWRHEEGVWRPLYERIQADDVSALAKEVDAQLQRFVDLIGRYPTHIDSHQHVHLRQPLRELVLDKAGQLGVPVREHSPVVRYVSSFYGQS